MRICVYGATGFTGRLITERLCAAGFPPLIAGRDERRLATLKAEQPRIAGLAVVEPTDSQKLGALMKRVDVFINCVGPFNLLGHTVLDCAALAGGIYIDITGEQAFVKSAFEKEGVAREHGSRLLLSFSFESCLADLLAAELCRADRQYLEIASYYSFEHSRPSAGTQLSMQLARHFGTELWSDGAFWPTAPLAVTRDVEFKELPQLNKAVFMPYPEVYFFARAWKPRHAGSYLLVDGHTADFMAATSNSALRPLEEIVERHRKKKFLPPSPEERKNQNFSLQVEAVGVDGRREHIGVSGHDMYGVTAGIVAATVEKLQEMDGRGSPKALRPGIVLPHEVLDLSGLVRKLASPFGLVSSGVFSES